ncbi:hypothetical protein ACGFJT_01750 [Actinomadura geliboluensis]|uniref:hypothetical protein n=1 Tax=Actinomadura geliboluensis TaxID=882440 RepID=UPI003723D8DA
MTRQLTQAAPKLADLADELWQALHAAQVSTAPAMEIKRIAAWADRAASDLRRRNQLAHDLDRQRLAFTICRPDGDYLKLPDRYTDQVGYAAGRRSADLFRRAASGDPAAKAALRALRPGDITPMFAKGLLESLGPEALLKLPMDLTVPLTADVRHDREGVDARAAETRAILALLGRSLALSTRPGTAAYLGDDYLRNLTRAGRANFPPLSTPPHGTAGYQSLSALLAAAGDTRFSAHFIDTVGSDMIAYDGRLRKTLGEEPLPTLAGKAGLGNALDPTTTKVVPNDNKTDFLAALLTAAAHSGKEASQALLTHTYMGPFEQGTEPGFKATTLQYLLHDRRPVWSATDHGTALGEAIQTAATGQDAESTRLAFDAAKILIADARKNFVVKEGKIQVGDKAPLDALMARAPADAIARPKHYDELSGLRPAMATVLVAHIERLHDIRRLSDDSHQAGSTRLTGADLDYLLLDITRSAGAYEILLLGQVAHAKVAIDRTVARHGNLENTIAGEGNMFGHIVEARHQSLGAENLRLADDLTQMRNYIGFGIGTIPVEYTPITRAPVVGNVFTAVVGKLASKITDVLAKKLADKADPAVSAPTTDVEGMERLFNQMIATSLVAHGRYPADSLHGRSFVDGRNKIIPVGEMNPRQLEDFLRWASNKMPLESHGDDVTGSMGAGALKAARHYQGADGSEVPPSVQR